MFNIKYLAAAPAIVSIITAVPAQAGICDDLNRFLAAAKDKPGFGSLDERIANGETIGYTKPSAEWGMPEGRKCSVYAEWKPKGKKELHRGASIECEIKRHYGKSLDDITPFTDALIRMENALSACPALAKWKRIAIAELQPGETRGKQGSFWQRRKKGPFVTVSFERQQSRRNLGYYTRVRIEKAPRK